MCWSFGVVGFERYPCCRLKHLCFSLQTNHTETPTHIEPRQIRQQNSRKLLMMDILLSETFWTHKKWNKIASDIKLVVYSSTIKHKYCYFISEEDQENAQFFSLNYSNYKLSSTCFEPIIFHHQQVISVHAAYSILPWIYGVSSR